MDRWLDSYSLFTMAVIMYGVSLLLNFSRASSVLNFSRATSEWSWCWCCMGAVFGYEDVLNSKIYDFQNVSPSLPFIILGS